MIILGIETSCDETAVSLIKAASPKNIKLVAETVSSQISIHKKFKGIVPEVAARKHLVAMIPTLEATLKNAKLQPKNISAIAVTSGPGLVTSLRVGVETAKILSYAWKKPLIRLNHTEGHIYANWFDMTDKPRVKFPALCLVVSGGHTDLILMKGHGDYKLLGRTLDDAAGEAFDKVAKLLNIGYPGGPKIQKLAAKGNPEKFDFPRPMLNRKSYDFSFSGLKTAVLYLVKKEFANKKIHVADICASFQQAVIDVLVNKTVRAAKEFKVKSVIIGGGVAANQNLRDQLRSELKNKLPQCAYYLPSTHLCTDNASMIAIAGYFHALKKDYITWDKLVADPNWELV